MKERNMVTDQSDGAINDIDQRYRHLFENMPICVFIADLTQSPTVILEVNQRAGLVYGYTSAELVGMPATHLMPQEATLVAQTIVQQVQQGQTVTTETTNQRRDGTTFPVRVVATLDPINSGQMIVTVEDITAERQRRSEAEAIASERLRIAHEIHDGVAQNLAAIRFKSALWSHLADTAPPGMRAALSELKAVLTATIADLRRAIFALRPLDLDALGFFPALAQWVGDFGEQNQLTVQLEVSGSQDALPAVYELPLFRIIQESLNNIRQHACASSIQVRLTVDEDGAVVVSVGDNGQGFDPSQLEPGDHAGHFGLLQMRERILDLGGSLDILSNIGKGTELHITLPALAKDINHASN